MCLISKIQKQEYIFNNILKDNNVAVRILKCEDIHKGKIIILQEEKVKKVFEIEAISSCQIKIIEKNITLEEGLFTDNLCKWLYNLYNNVEYLYTFSGGNLSGKTLTRKEIDKIANGKTQDMYKEIEQGITVHRKELDNQPTVNGYLGPMFGKIEFGKIYLNYETQEIYDMLSR